MHAYHMYDIYVDEGIVSINDIFDRYLASFPIKREYKSKSGKTQKTRAAMPDKVKVFDIRISDIATRPAETISYTADAFEAAKKMKEKDIMSLVILQKGHYKGVLTAKNILKSVASNFIPPKYNVIFTGIKKLKEYQVDFLKKIAGREAEKIGGPIKIRFRYYKQTGMRRKYSVSMQVLSKAQITSHAHDWSFETALRKGLNKLRRLVP